MSVNFFAYLVLHDKILSRDVLNIRGLMIDLRCVMCTVCHKEQFFVLATLLLHVHVPCSARSTIIFFKML